MSTAKILQFRKPEPEKKDILMIILNGDKEKADQLRPKLGPRARYAMENLNKMLNDPKYQ